MRTKVTRVFFYDSIPSIGSNCLAEGEWDSELGVIFHKVGDKLKACSVMMVREMTVVQTPVVLAEPAPATAQFAPANTSAVAKVVKVPADPDPMKTEPKRRRIS